MLLKKVLYCFGYRGSAASGTSQLQCNTCKRSYSGNETHLDLAVASGSNQYTEPMPLSTELFRCVDDMNDSMSSSKSIYCFITLALLILIGLR